MCVCVFESGVYCLCCVLVCLWLFGVLYVCACVLSKMCAYLSVGVGVSVCVCGFVCVCIHIYITIYICVCVLCIHVVCACLPFFEHANNAKNKEQLSGSF